MKRLTFFIVGILGCLLIRILTFTVRIEQKPKGILDKLKRANYIYAVWHNSMLVLSHIGRNTNVHALISQHSDGEYIAQVVKRLGLGVIRGSTTRGGSRATRALLKKAEEGYSIGITPDGPRGPRYVVQSGCIYLSRKTGFPIVPVTVGLSNYWKLPSWDEFRIPKPFSRALILYGEPVYIPPHCSDKETEHYRLALEKTMNEMAQKADCFVKGTSS